MAREKIIGVYLITIIPNGMVYVGSTVDIFFRWQQHKRSFRKNSYQSNQYLLKYWNEYGEENFDWKILEICESKELAEKAEQKWINHYKSADRKFGCNISEAGNNKQALETRKKMSEARKGMKFSKETKKNMSKAHGGTGNTMKLVAPSMKIKTRSLSIGSIKKRINKKKEELNES